MLLPGLLTAAALLVTEHNLWPRFFFFCAGFAVLIVLRGLMEAVKLVPGRFRHAVTVAAAATLIAASSYTLPRAYGPKQDFAGARAYVQRYRGPEDAVVTLDLADFPYRSYLREDWLSAGSERELERIEQNHARTWVLYTFPMRLAAVRPDLWERLEEAYATAAEFPGTVGGGTVVVKVYESNRG